MHLDYKICALITTCADVGGGLLAAVIKFGRRMWQTCICELVKKFVLYWIDNLESAEILNVKG